MFSRVIRVSRRMPVRLTASSSSSSSSATLRLSKRMMGGSAGHGAADHGHGHATGGPVKPRVQSVEDQYKFGPQWQEQATNPAHTTSDEKWKRVFVQHTRADPFHYTDPRSATWFSKIPVTEESEQSKEGFRASSRYALPRTAALVAAFGVGAYFYFKPERVANLEGKEQKPAGSGLNPAAFAPLTLVDIRPYNHNTKQYVFALAAPDAKLNLPTASFVLVKSAHKADDGKDVIRPYTPIDQHVTGQLHLLVKQYPGGLLTGYLANLKVGDAVQFKGPIRKLEYKPNLKKTIGMIAGGTGITPMLQVIDEVLSNPTDTTQLRLLFANDTAADILLRERLDELKARYGDRFDVHYVLAKPGADWTGEKGYVNAALIQKYMPAPGPDALVMVCGPPPMMKALSGDKVKNATTGAMEQGPVDGVLKTLKYSSDNVFKF